MRLPFISRRKHERLMEEKWEQCRETLLIRGRLWAKNLAMYEKEIRNLKRQIRTENGTGEVDTPHEN